MHLLLNTQLSSDQIMEKFTNNRRATMALYQPTGKYVKCLHAKHYNTWPIGFEHKAPEIELKLVALVLIVSYKKISEDFTI